MGGQSGIAELPESLAGIQEVTVQVSGVEGGGIEKFLASDQKEEAWKRIASWYRKASGRQAPPLREHLDRITTERAEIYRCRPPEELHGTILVTPSEVEDRVPEESEVAQKVRRLKGGRVGGPSGMCEEDLKGWLWESSWEKKLVKCRWQLLVRLIQRTFEDGVVPE